MYQYQATSLPLMALLSLASPHTRRHTFHVSFISTEALCTFPDVAGFPAEQGTQAATFKTGPGMRPILGLRVSSPTPGIAGVNNAKFNALVLSRVVGRGVSRITDRRVRTSKFSTDAGARSRMHMCW